MNNIYCSVCGHEWNANEMPHHCPKCESENLVVNEFYRNQFDEFLNGLFDYVENA